MRRSTIATVLFSSLAMFACSSGGSSAQEGASENGSANGGSDSDTDGGAGAVMGAPSKGSDAGGSANGNGSADATPVVTPDGCPIAASPSDNPCVLRNEIGVFVSSSKGSDDAGDGSMASPFASASHGIAFAEAHQKRVFLCAETYAEVVTFEDGVYVFGGLDCSAAQWTVSATRAHFAETTDAIAAHANNVQNTTVVEALEIVAPDATTSSGSSIGMIVNASPALSLVNVLIQSGNAMKGDDGVEGTQLQNGPGINGGNGIAPLASSFAAMDPSGGSGTAANICQGEPGYVGTAGNYGGTGGNYQATTATCFGGGYCWAAGLPITNGTIAGPGGGGSSAVGTSGANGKSAMGIGALSVNGYTPADGMSGASGTPGAGGAGSSGFAPSSAGMPAADFAGKYFTGVGGAGGGAGGCPGLAGTAGKGGGASMALIAIASSIKLVGSTITAGNGGAGGGGTFGSTPTQGGSGGAGYDGNPGGNGGGAGGASGVSGAGAAGPSIAIAYSGGLPVIDAATVLTPGTGGTGIAAQSNGAKTIPASADGVSQAIYSF